MSDPIKAALTPRIMRLVGTSQLTLAHDARVICSRLGGSPMSIGVHQFVRLFVTRFLAGIVLAVMLTSGGN